MWILLGGMCSVFVKNVAGSTVPSSLFMRRLCFGLAAAFALACLALITSFMTGGDVRAQAASSSLQPNRLDRERAEFPICKGPRRHTCVVDGDTIWYRGAKIRIADIDAPEVTRPRCRREAALGSKATQRLQSLLNAAPFRFEPAPDGRQQDRFGRELKVIKRSNTSIGALMVREGLAKRWVGQRRSWC